MIHAWLMFGLVAMALGCGEARLSRCRHEGEALPNVKSVERGRCCWGLERKELYFSEVIVNGVSYCKADPIYESVFACFECGDGTCDTSFEDKCICPEDCGEVPERRYVDETQQLPEAEMTSLE